MNNVHDMGGMQAYGPVPKPIPIESPFHARWEGRVFAMQMATMMLGVWKPGVIRGSVESLPPAVYLAASYYQRWELGLERRLIASGMVTADELSAGRASRPGWSLAPPRNAKIPPNKAPIRPGGSEAATPPAFQVGQTVWARNLNPPTHTRLPRYARDHVGVISAIRGVQSLPDAHVLSDREELQWVYGVEFSCRELWGAAADPQAKIFVDAWEAYLERV
jgi:nitrile hydratase